MKAGVHAEKVRQTGEKREWKREKWERSQTREVESLLSSSFSPTSLFSLLSSLSVAYLGFPFDAAAAAASIIIWLSSSPASDATIFHVESFLTTTPIHAPRLGIPGIADPMV